MNSLLKRQIRKYLSEEKISDPELAAFFDAVNRSYDNSEEHFTMLQRAMTISSEELYEANNKLIKETESQKDIIQKLKKVVDNLKIDDSKDGLIEDDLQLDENKFIDFINNRTDEIVELNAQRDKLLKDLEHQNQELSDYAHMVSHDLKSPLRSVDALSKWLYDDYQSVLGEDGKYNLEMIRNNVQKMDTLIDGILDYSTIGKTKIETYDVEIKSLLDEIIEILYIPKHISIHKANYFPTVKGDKHRLMQVFQNLISNAIKYNDKEHGKVEIGFYDQKDCWEFYVRDNGIGIEEKYFNRIFKTFEKLQNSPTSSGIGLSIAKKIVSLYQGQIWVVSEVNKGSTFYFTIKK